ncbi:MAG: alpha/beta hydrolase [Thermomicrobiales bacterium]
MMRTQSPTTHEAGCRFLGRRSALRTALALLVVLLGATAALPPAMAQPPVPQIAWWPCRAPWQPASAPAPGSGENPAGLECATLDVPLDYAQPAGPTITLGLNRLRARDQEHRIGPLFVNPGGPGGSSVEIVAAAAIGLPLFSDELRDRFDLVGLDPRGVGVSSPVQCDPDLYNQPVSRFPETEEEFAALVAYNTALGQSCLTLTGPLLAHIDTGSAARDLEQARLALGDEPLNYLGFSYGSSLGAQYAALYPGNIRTMALDGILPREIAEIPMVTGEASGYEAAFDRFVAWCAADTACVLHGKDAGAIFDRLVASADETLLPAPACANGAAPRPCRPTVRGEDMRIAAQEMLLFSTPFPDLGIAGWNTLAQAIADAEAGDASAFSPQLATSPSDPLFASGPAIACLDYPAESHDFADLRAREILGEAIAPRLHGASQTWTILTGCIGWPEPGVSAPGPDIVHGAPPILLVNSTGDPSTVYPWAVAVQARIEGSVLVTRIGEGHTSYSLPGTNPARDAIDTYLLTGETPPPNTVYGG